MQYLQIVHAIPGRTRLRYPALRRDPARVALVADSLAANAGVHEVKIRPYTGSILVTHEPAVTTDVLVETVQRVVACDRVVALGESPPMDREIPQLSKIAKLAATAFREIDRDVMRATDGNIDLGTLVTLGFFGAGAAEVAIEREVAMPPWFNLAWWGYRTFMTNEQAEIAAAKDE
jgi:hypothetical protein